MQSAMRPRIVLILISALLVAAQIFCIEEIHGIRSKKIHHRSASLERKDPAESGRKKGIYEADGLPQGPQALRRRSHRATRMRRSRYAGQHAVADGRGGEDQGPDGTELQAVVKKEIVPSLLRFSDRTFCQSYGREVVANNLHFYFRPSILEGNRQRFPPGLSLRRVAVLGVAVAECLRAEFSHPLRAEKGQDEVLIKFLVPLGKAQNALFSVLHNGDRAGNAVSAHGNLSHLAEFTF